MRFGSIGIVCFIALPAMHPVPANLGPNPIVFAAALPSGGEVGLNAYYASTSWPALHRDSSNSDFVPFVSAPAVRVSWTALDGAAVVAPPTLGPEGNLYITTGQGPGTSHLHAFDRDGHLLWESPPQQSLADLDSEAVGSAPTVDSQGDLYVSDSNQFWAFHFDGTLKWVVDLPEPGYPLVSSAITREGFVGGITTGGKVFLVNRDNGSLAAPILDLPGGPGPVGPQVPAGLWAGGLMDPAIIKPIYHALLGYESEVANTPAVHPTTGRIFITAAGAERNVGVLYGIDLIGGELSIAFQAPLTAGSGTSPALSPDGRQVYAVGGDRVMVAFDTDTGAVLWRASAAGSASSPAVGPGGTIYTGDKQYLQAIDPSDGTAIWRVDLLPLAQEYLTRRIRTSRTPVGIPVAHVNSVVCITPTHLLAAVVLGYQLNLPEYGPTAPQPRYTLLCSIDPLDGHIISATEVRDTSEAIISTGMDGRLYFPHCALLSSIAYYGLNPQLPVRLRIDGPPLAGLSVLEPVSYIEQVSDGILWVQNLAMEALQGLPDGEATWALNRLNQARRQLAASTDSVNHDLMNSREIADGRAETIRILLVAAESHFRNAENLLLSDTVQSRSQINLAVDNLDDALALLHDRLFVRLDIMPGACPNFLDLHPNTKHTIDIAILGGPGLDVSEISHGSVSLIRVDGVGGSVRPMATNRGVSGHVEDIPSPVGDSTCSCESTHPDRFNDYIFTFSASELIDMLELENGGLEDAVPLKLSGTLLDGSPFHATDCVWPVKRSLGAE